MPTPSRDCDAVSLPLSQVASHPGSPRRLRGKARTELLVGQSILPDDPPRRIVSLAPSNTEIRLALGAAHCVVAVSQSCDPRDTARVLLRVSHFVDVLPDLALTSSDLPKDIVDRLIDRDLTLLAFNQTDVAASLRRRTERMVTGRRSLAWELRAHLEEK